MSLTPRQRAVFVAFFILAFAGAAGAQAVRGTVHVASGNAPAAYAIVVFSQGGAEKARAITDANGFYYVRNLPAGAYDVKVLRQNRERTSQVQVPSAGGTFDFRAP
jgi:hypothetical protein